MLKHSTCYCCSYSPDQKIEQHIVLKRLKLYTKFGLQLHLFFQCVPILKLSVLTDLSGQTSFGTTLKLKTLVLLTYRSWHNFMLWVLKRTVS